MTINITVAYATPSKQVEIPLLVEESCTVALAIQRSKIFEQFPELNKPAASLDVGIYSCKVSLDSLIQEGDRIEIYRPLQVGPKEARRLRVKSGSPGQARG